MKALSLFTGIMGIDVACERAGIETIAMCERDAFCQKVIRKHKPNIPLYDDVCELTRERMESDGIDCDTIGLIHSGYPCQPYSVAGDRDGEEDDRALWPEVKRLLEEIRPNWFVGENVPGHISLGLDDVLSDLDSIGYTAEPIVFPATAVGAIHRRDRLFILAYSMQIGSKWDISKALQGEQTLQRFNDARKAKEWAERSTIFEPKLHRVTDGISGGMDRLRNGALGNAVSPPQFYPIALAIKQLNDMLQAV